MKERMTAAAREARQNYLKERQRRNLNEIENLRERNRKIRAAGRVSNTPRR